MKYFVADAHCDTLYARTREGKDAQRCQVSADKMARGGMMLGTFALWPGTEPPSQLFYEVAMGSLDESARLDIPIYKALPDTVPESPGGVLSVEGGEAFMGDMRLLGEFLDAGVKMIALTHNRENELGYPALGGDTRGLKPFGREVMREMNRRGVLADVSHLNIAGFWEVMELAEIPPVASHSNARALCDHPRNLTDEQIKAIVARGGFIGINFFSSFLVERGEATLSDVARHIDRIAQLGGISCLGLGSDFDGIGRWPEGLDGAEKFPLLLDFLERWGYKPDDLAAIAGINLWNLYKLAEARA